MTFTSRNEWNSLPERLTVNHDGREYGERIRQHAFYTDERAALGFVFSGLHLSLNSRHIRIFPNLDTDIWGIESPNIADGEQLTTNYMRVFAAPKLEWGYRKLELMLNVPPNMYSLFLLRWASGQDGTLHIPVAVGKVPVHTEDGTHPARIRTTLPGITAQHT